MNRLVRIHRLFIIESHQPDDDVKNIFKEAENIIRKAETAAGEQAASDMKAAEERAHSTENTVVGQAEEELAALKKKAESKHEQAIQTVMDSLF